MGNTQDPPQYRQPPLDPLFVAQQQAAQQDDIKALMVKARGDTASVMSRYGTTAALRGFSAAPLGSL